MGIPKFCGFPPTWKFIGKRITFFLIFCHIFFFPLPPYHAR
jgi:hypothetical protein